MDIEGSPEFAFNTDEMTVPLTAEEADAMDALERAADDVKSLTGSDGRKIIPLNLWAAYFGDLLEQDSAPSVDKMPVSCKALGTAKAKAFQRARTSLGQRGEIIMYEKNQYAMTRVDTVDNART